MSWEKRWRAADGGLIFCWENGRIYADANPEIAQQARSGELPILVWKGGVDKKLKTNQRKYGTLMYLAMWQGIRGDNLEINTDEEVPITCSRTGQQVLFRAGTVGLDNETS